MNNLPASQDVSNFIEIARALNISRAAERLGVTQPSLTVSLQRLERDVGVKLVLRDKTGVRLTKAGENFYKSARDLLIKWTALRSDTLQKNLQVSGRYKFGAHPSVAIYSWTKILKGIYEKHPEIDVEFKFDHSRKVTDMLIQSEIDFAISVNPVRHLDLVLKKIGDDRVEPWVSAKASYNAKILIYDPEMLQAQSLLPRLSRNNFTQFIHTSNLEVLADLVDQGVGVGLLPGRVAKQGLHFQLKPLSKESPYFEDKIYFLYRKDSHVNPASQQLIESIYSSLVKVFTS